MVCNLSPEKYHDRPLSKDVEAFRLSRGVGNCTAETPRTYEAQLRRFAVAVEDATSLTAQASFNSLRDSMGPISVHKHYRPLRAFFARRVDARICSDNPRGHWPFTVGRARRTAQSSLEQRALMYESG